jgi:hypothetical protein
LPPQRDLAAVAREPAVADRAVARRGETREQRRLRRARDRRQHRGHRRARRERQQVGRVVTDQATREADDVEEQHGPHENRGC